MYKEFYNFIFVFYFEILVLFQVKQNKIIFLIILKRLNLYNFLNFKIY